MECADVGPEEWEFCVCTFYRLLPNNMAVRQGRSEASRHFATCRRRHILKRSEYQEPMVGIQAYLTGMKILYPAAKCRQIDAQESSQGQEMAGTFFHMKTS